MAPAPREPAHRRAARRRGDAARRLGGDGGQRSRADAGPARPGGARRVRPADPKRSAAAAIDWFSVFFFTSPSRPAGSSTSRCRPARRPSSPPTSPSSRPAIANTFSALALALALAGTVAWLWLVRWRTGRHRHRSWKSLVLPAGGVSVCWLLVMTLLLPPLDNARSYRSMVQRIAQQVPAGAASPRREWRAPQVVALEYLGGYRVDASATADHSGCEILMLTRTPQSCRLRPGCSSRANDGYAATTTSPTSTAASARLTPARRHGVVNRVAAVGASAAGARRRQRARARPGRRAGRSSPCRARCRCRARRRGAA